MNSASIQQPKATEGPTVASVCSYVSKTLEASASSEGIYGSAGMLVPQMSTAYSSGSGVFLSGEKSGDGMGAEQASFTIMPRMKTEDLFADEADEEEGEKASEIEYEASDLSKEFLVRRAQRKKDLQRKYCYDFDPKARMEKMHHQEVKGIWSDRTFTGMFGDPFIQNTELQGGLTNASANMLNFALEILQGFLVDKKELQSVFFPEKQFPNLGNVKEALHVSTELLEEIHEVFRTPLSHVEEPQVTEATLMTAGKKLAEKLTARKEGELMLMPAGWAGFTANESHAIMFVLHRGKNDMVDVALCNSGAGIHFHAGAGGKTITSTLLGAVPLSRLGRPFFYLILRTMLRSDRRQDCDFFYTCILQIFFSDVQKSDWQLPEFTQLHSPQNAGTCYFKCMICALRIIFSHYGMSVDQSKTMFFLLRFSLLAVAGSQLEAAKSDLTHVPAIRVSDEKVLRMAAQQLLIKAERNVACQHINLKVAEYAAALSQSVMHAIPQILSDAAPSLQPHLPAFDPVLHHISAADLLHPGFDLFSSEELVGPLDGEKAPELPAIASVKEDFSTIMAATETLKKIVEIFALDRLSESQSPVLRWCGFAYYERVIPKLIAPEFFNRILGDGEKKISVEDRTAFLTAVNDASQHLTSLWCALSDSSRLVASRFLLHTVLLAVVDKCARSCSCSVHEKIPSVQSFLNVATVNPYQAMNAESLSTELLSKELLECYCAVRSYFIEAATVCAPMEDPKTKKTIALFDVFFGKPQEIGFQNSDSAERFQLELKRPECDIAFALMQSYTAANTGDAPNRVLGDKPHADVETAWQDIIVVQVIRDCVYLCHLASQDSRGEKNIGYFPPSLNGIESQTALLLNSCGMRDEVFKMEFCGVTRLSSQPRGLFGFGRRKENVPSGEFDTPAKLRKSLKNPPSEMKLFVDRGLSKPMSPSFSEQDDLSFKQLMCSPFVGIPLILEHLVERGVWRTSASLEPLLECFLFEVHQWTEKPSTTEAPPEMCPVPSPIIPKHTPLVHDLTKHAESIFLPFARLLDISISEEKSHSAVTGASALSNAFYASIRLTSAVCALFLQFGGQAPMPDLFLGKLKDVESLLDKFINQKDQGKGGRWEHAEALFHRALLLTSTKSVSERDGAEVICQHLEICMHALSILNMNSSEQLNTLPVDSLCRLYCARSTLFIETLNSKMTEAQRDRALNSILQRVLNDPKISEKTWKSMEGNHSFVGALWKIDLQTGVVMSLISDSAFLPESVCRHSHCQLVFGGNTQIGGSMKRKTKNFSQYEVVASGATNEKIILEYWKPPEMNLKLLDQLKTGKGDLVLSQDRTTLMLAGGTRFTRFPKKDSGIITNSLPKKFHGILKQVKECFVLDEKNDDWFSLLGEEETKKGKADIPAVKRFIVTQALDHEIDTNALPDPVCPEGHKFHVLFAQPPGYFGQGYICDECRRHFLTNEIKKSRVPFLHCPKCQFDLCPNCHSHKPDLARVFYELWFVGGSPSVDPLGLVFSLQLHGRRLVRVLQWTSDYRRTQATILPDESDFLNHPWSVNAAAWSPMTLADSVTIRVEHPDGHSYEFVAPESVRGIFPEAIHARCTIWRHCLPNGGGCDELILVPKGSVPTVDVVKSTKFVAHFSEDSKFYAFIHQLPGEVTSPIGSPGKSKKSQILMSNICCQSDFVATCVACLSRMDCYGSILPWLPVSDFTGGAPPRDLDLSKVTFDLPRIELEFALRPAFDSHAREALRLSSLHHPGMYVCTENTLQSAEPLWEIMNGLGHGLLLQADTQEFAVLLPAMHVIRPFRPGSPFSNFTFTDLESVTSLQNKCYLIPIHFGCWKIFPQSLEVGLYLVQCKFLVREYREAIFFAERCTRDTKLTKSEEDLLNKIIDIAEPEEAQREDGHPNAAAALLKLIIAVGHCTTSQGRAPFETRSYGDSLISKLYARYCRFRHHVSSDCRLTQNEEDRLCAENQLQNPLKKPSGAQDGMIHECLPPMSTKGYLNKVNQFYHLCDRLVETPERYSPNNLDELNESIPLSFERLVQNFKAKHTLSIVKLVTRLDSRCFAGTDEAETQQFCKMLGVMLGNQALRMILRGSDIVWVGLIFNAMMEADSPNFVKTLEAIFSRVGKDPAATILVDIVKALSPRFMLRTPSGPWVNDSFHILRFNISAPQRDGPITLAAGQPPHVSKFLYTNFKGDRQLEKLDFDFTLAVDTKLPVPHAPTKPEAPPGEQIPQCNAGHVLKKFAAAPSPEYVQGMACCDGCAKNFAYAPDTPGYHCPTCQYDVCPQCYEVLKTARIVQFDGVRVEVPFGKWLCSNCTMMNDDESPVCTMCGSPKLTEENKSPKHSADSILVSISCEAGHVLSDVPLSQVLWSDNLACKECGNKCPQWRLPAINAHFNMKISAAGPAADKLVGTITTTCTVDDEHYSVDVPSKDVLFKPERLKMKVSEAARASHTLRSVCGTRTSPSDFNAPLRSIHSGHFGDKSIFTVRLSEATEKQLTSVPLRHFAEMLAAEIKKDSMQSMTTEGSLTEARDVVSDIASILKGHTLHNVQSGSHAAQFANRVMTACEDIQGQEINASQVDEKKTEEGKNGETLESISDKLLYLLLQSFSHFESKSGSSSSGAISSVEKSLKILWSHLMKLLRKDLRFSVQAQDWAILQTTHVDVQGDDLTADEIVLRKIHSARLSLDPFVVPNFLSTARLLISSTFSDDLRYANPYMSRGTAATEQIANIAIIAMLRASRAAQIRRVMTFTKTAWQMLHTSSTSADWEATAHQLVSGLLCKREYTVHHAKTNESLLDMRLVLFEYLFEVMLWDRQLSMMDMLYQQVKEKKSIVAQLLMGLGKSSVVTPLLAMRCVNDYVSGGIQGTKPLPKSPPKWFSIDPRDNSNSPYEPDVNQAIEKSFQEGESQHMLQFGTSKFHIVFADMRQYNASGGSRKVVRQDSASNAIKGGAVVLVVPSALIEQTLRVLGHRYTAMTGSPVIHMEVQRRSGDLGQLFQRVQRAIDVRGVLVASPETVKGIELRLVETFLAASKGKKVKGGRQADAPDDMQTCAGLQKVVKAFRAGVCILDEADVILSPLKSELNFPIGTQRSVLLAPLRWQFVLSFLRRTLAGLSEVVQRRGITSASQSATTSSTASPDSPIKTKTAVVVVAAHPHVHVVNTDWLTSPQGFLTRLCLAALEAINEVCCPLLIGKEGEDKGSCSVFASDSERNEALKFLTEPSIVVPPVNRRIPKKLFVLAKQWIYRYSSHVLSKVRNLGYGLPKKENLKKEPNRVLAVPYLALDVASPTSEFAHPDIAIGFTCLTFFHGGLRAEDFSRCVVSLQQKLWKEEGEIQDRPTFSKFEEMVERTKNNNSVPSLHLIDSTNSEVVEAAAKEVAFCPSLLEFYLSEIVFPQCMMFGSKKIHASAQDFANDIVFQTTVGFTGTPEDVVPKTITSVHERQDLAKIVATLSDEKIVTIEPLFETAVDGILNRVFEDQRFHALIDCAGLINGVTNENVAKRCLQARTKGSRAAVFLDEDNAPRFITHDDMESHRPLVECNVPFHERFVFFDQLHCTGVDIQQSSVAHAAILLGKDVTLRDVAQAVWRMRQLGRGTQRATLLVPETLNALMKQSPVLAKQSPPCRLLCWLVDQSIRGIQSNSAKLSEQQADVEKLDRPQAVGQLSSCGLDSKETMKVVAKKGRHAFVRTIRHHIKNEWDGIDPANLDTAQEQQQQQQMQSQEQKVNGQLWNPTPAVSWRIDKLTDPEASHDFSSLSQWEIRAANDKQRKVELQTSPKEALVTLNYQSALMPKDSGDGDVLLDVNVVMQIRAPEEKKMYFVLLTLEEAQAMKLYIDCGGKEAQVALWSTTGLLLASNLPCPPIVSEVFASLQLFKFFGSSTAFTEAGVTALLKQLQLSVALKKGREASNAILDDELVFKAELTEFFRVLECCRLLPGRELKQSRLGELCLVADAKMALEGILFPRVHQQLRTYPQSVEIATAVTNKILSRNVVEAVKLLQDQNQEELQDLIAESAEIECSVRQAEDAEPVDTDGEESEAEEETEELQPSASDALARLPPELQEQLTPEMLQQLMAQLQASGTGEGGGPPDCCIS